jgi:hypothetical protein
MQALAVDSQRRQRAYPGISQISTQATVRSAIRGYGKFCIASAYGVALVWLGLGCGNTNAQTRNTGGSSSRGSHKVGSCKKDSQCPSGQRCGFTSGCESKGKCVVPSRDASCIDPSGRCGCDGRPVDIFLRRGFAYRIHVGSGRFGGTVSTILHQGDRVWISSKYARRVSALSRKNQLARFYERRVRAEAWIVADCEVLYSKARRKETKAHVTEQQRPA